MTGSKEGQDRFVLTLIKEPGYFLDIGCAEPIENNNSYVLERHGWLGLLIDQNEKAIHDCKPQRHVDSYVADVSKLDWKKFLNYNNVPKTIDYISLDVDDANIPVIQSFPLDEYEFKILTYETDAYNSRARQDAAKQVLGNYPQYELILEDALLEDGRPWEDWWINKNYFDEKILNCKAANVYWKTFVENLEECKR